VKPKTIKVNASGMIEGEKLGRMAMRP